MNDTDTVTVSSEEQEKTGEKGGEGTEGGEKPHKPRGGRNKMRCDAYLVLRQELSQRSRCIVCTIPHTYHSRSISLVSFGDLAQIIYDNCVRSIASPRRRKAHV